MNNKKKTKPNRISEWFTLERRPSTIPFNISWKRLPLWKIRMRYRNEWKTEQRRISRIGKYRKTVKHSNSFSFIHTACLCPLRHLGILQSFVWFYCVHFFTFEFGCFSFSFRLPPKCCSSNSKQNFTRRK